jgi:hypothetical protein
MGVRVNLVTANAVREPRNLRLLGSDGRLVPTKLSHEEIEDLQFKVGDDGRKSASSDMLNE